MRVVYQDRWIVVVDKPCGLPTQATRAGEQGLFELLLAEHPYVGLHHRLDRPASGLVVLAVHEDANKGLAAAFRERTAQRTYRAVLAGVLGGDHTWDAPLDGKTARTEVRVRGCASGFTAVEVRLHTGRTHQIRRHAAMAGVPVAGDRRYGGEAGRAWSRLALHAWRLLLRHPTTGQPLDLEAPLPEDLLPLWAMASPQADRGRA